MDEKIKKLSIEGEDEEIEPLDEAYIIQSDLEQRGAIHSIRGKRLCLERINQMKKSR